MVTRSIMACSLPAMGRGPSQLLWRALYCAYPDGGWGGPSPPVPHWVPRPSVDVVGWGLLFYSCLENSGACWGLWS